jgi:uroporphyrin-III C-methyltransferase
MWFKATRELRGNNALRQNRKSSMEANYDPLITGAVHRVQPPGLVTLVGAGPGDPDLLTMRAVKVLQAARVVLYDHLVSDSVLALVGPRAERIYVGKQDKHHALEQEKIIELLVRIARTGNPVVRLKGGDPYVFGRGGEEVQALARARIPFEVIPGITAAQGMSAYAGIPLTHRDHAASVVFVTGHSKETGGDPDWAALARPRQTVVFYMGIGALPRICQQLIAHGLRADTPAAVVERATCAQQRVIVATLLTLPAMAAAHAVKAPALIVVGSVVALHDELAWFDPQPKPAERSIVAPMPATI